MKRFSSPRIVWALLAVVGLGIFLWSSASKEQGAPSPSDAEARLSPPPSSAVTSPPAPAALIGKVKGAEIVAREEPSADAAEIGRFPRLNEQGSPQVFLLRSEGAQPPENEGWVEALLPVRPNGTTGYLPIEELEILSTDYRIEVDRSDFELTVYEADRELMRVPVSLGTGATPTPVGVFYLASLLEPPDPTTVYGPYAYGLSGYSETLTDWKDGGIIGLHGTNDPASIGKAVSHGCIRMRNKDITKLIPLLPLGTPIEIT